MPVECIDWRRFAYRRSGGNSASLPKVPRARRLEDALGEGQAQGSSEAAAAEAAAAPVKGDGQARNSEEAAAPSPHTEKAAASAAAPETDARRVSPNSSDAAAAGASTSTPAAESAAAAAAAAADSAGSAASPAEAAPASEAAAAAGGAACGSSAAAEDASVVSVDCESPSGASTPPPVRLASLHDRGGGRSSGWLTFGSGSTADRSSSSSRSRLSEGRAAGGARRASSKASSSSSKQQKQQQQGEAAAGVVKKRKLLRGGVAALGSPNSDGEQQQQPAAAAGEGKSLKNGRRSSGGCSSGRSSSSSGGECSESDEESLDALQLCLQESEAMTDLLVEELGGPTAEGRALVRSQIGEGRCHCRSSLGIPETLQQHCGEGWARLKDYQRCGVHWLAAMHRANRNGILADEMGLGKTAQTCVFFNYAYSSGLLSSPTLVAAPASLVDNWVRELQTWAPHLEGRIVKYAGKQSDRRSLALECIESLQGPKPFRVLVASVNSLSNKWDVQYLRQLRPFAYLVVDEAHALKNKDSQVYRNINKMARCERRILLTGSPIQNRTGELRNLLLFLMPAVFDAESLDLALSAFEKQAHRQQRLLGANKAKKNKDNQHQQQQQQQAEQGEGDSSNVSGGGVVAAECEETSGAGEGQEEKSVEDKGFLSRALESLASRGGRGSCGIDPRGLPADVTCLQRVLSPFILRRLKAEVMQELPRKTNIVLRCELEGSQKALYLKEVRHHESDLALSLRRLTHAFAANEEIPNNNAGAAANPKAEAHEKGPQPTEADPKEPEGGGKRFVSSLLFRLRRICNHALLMQGKYSSEQKDRMARHYAYHVDGFKGNPIDKIRAEIDRWSDYEVHQGIRMLAEQGDMKLADLALPAEAFLESTKLRKAFELLREVQSRGEKALVFSQFTTFLDVLEEALQLHMPTLRFCRLDGSTIVEERQRLVDGFNQTEECTAFLLSTKAGGQGLNLTAARTVILLDQDWNPQNDRQAEDRVHRLGQTQEVTVYRLCCRGTVEESILKCCQRKLDLDSAFGGNSEILQAAILRDSLETGGLEVGESIIRLNSQTA